MSAPSERKIDARALITEDLAVENAKKRRHYMPALYLTVIAVAGFLLVMGFRPDMFRRPMELAIAAPLWLLALVGFPAIGLGLWFPNKATRIGLIVGAVALTFLQVVTGHNHQYPDAPMAFEFSWGWTCMGGVMAMGMMLTVLAMLSGAFQQRRASGSIYWIVAGVGLVAFNTVACHCSEDGISHILSSHVLGTLALGGVGIVAALLARKKPS